MSLSNLEKAKRGEMLKTLMMFKWNIAEACKHLGISRSTYYRNAKRYGLEKPKDE